MRYTAYWVSGQGDILPVPTLHIHLVVKYPERFGYTGSAIREIFKFHNEPLGHEGNARQEIMLDLIVNRGWVRARYTPRHDRWTVELNRLDQGIQGILRDFFTVIAGVGGGRSGGAGTASLYSEVRINELLDGKQVAGHVTTVRKLVVGQDCPPQREPGRLCVRLEYPRDVW